MKRIRNLLLTAAFTTSVLPACTTVDLPGGGRMQTPAEMKGVTFTPTSFHADEISHMGIYRSAQNFFTMLGLGAFVP